MRYRFTNSPLEKLMTRASQPHLNQTRLLNRPKATSVTAVRGMGWGVSGRATGML